MEVDRPSKTVENDGCDAKYYFKPQKDRRKSVAWSQRDQSIVGGCGTP